MSMVWVIIHLKKINQFRLTKYGFIIKDIITLCMSQVTNIIPMIMHESDMKVLFHATELIDIR